MSPVLEILRDADALLRKMGRVLNARVTSRRNVSNDGLSTHFGGALITVGRTVRVQVGVAVAVLVVVSWVTAVGNANRTFTRTVRAPGGTVGG